MLGELRYAATEIGNHYDDRDWWHQRIQSRVAGPILGLRNGFDGIDVMDADWDNLLVLDACRADMFEETIDTDQFDDYGRIISKGSSSPEWMRKNFAGKTFGNTVYITANPWISKVAPDSFHEVVNLWIMEEDVRGEDLEDAVSLEDLGFSWGVTITAEELNEVVREVADEYPNKRYIVHYFQPHAPCIGRPDGETIPDEEVDVDLHPGDTLKHGVVEYDEVWDAYTDNLQYAFHHANKLAEDLGGRSVFTADHGEMFGEWLWPVPMRGYAHPSGLRHKRLIEVPWAVKETGTRRRIIEGEVTHHEADEEEVDARLRDLGYKV